MKILPVNEAPNLIVIVEGTSLHHELTYHDSTGLRHRIVNLIEMLRSSQTVLNTDVNSLEETIECLDAAREELNTLSDDGLVKVVENCIGNTMTPEIKKLIADKRSKTLATIIQASLGLSH